MLTPGTHIPVQPAEIIKKDPPDYLVILAWNFADEIMDQQSEFKQNGGKFIIPLPIPKIIWMIWFIISWQKIVTI